MDSASVNSIVQDVAEGTLEWFQQSDMNHSNEQTLWPADEAIQEHDHFRRKLPLWALRSKHDSLRSVKTKDDLERLIEDPDGGYDTLKDHAFSTVNNATDVHVKYESDRAKGRKKIGRLAQNFVQSFASFLSVYSGIVELLKGAGQIYGAVAYETLSILFIIVVNKARNDSKISELLLELQKSFPRLDDWTKIYPTSAVKLLVAEVYKQVIIFARTASTYFTRFSTRLWSAVGRPPSLGIDRTVATIHAKLAEVNSETMIELHKRSQNIYITVKESDKRIKESGIEIKELRRSNGVLVRALERLENDHRKFVQEAEVKDREADGQRLEIFKGALDITYPCPETELDFCKESLSKTFSKVHINPRSPKLEHIQMSPSLLSTSASYNQWEESADACFLILSGKTPSEGRNSRGYTHSWLSPAAIHVTEKERGENRRVAFYSCHPNALADRHSGREIISSIIFQMLEWKPDVLRHKFQQFQSMVQSDAWRERENENTVLHVMFQLLRQVILEVHDLGRIYIVIDRIDLYSGNLRKMMNELVELVTDQSHVVKVMAVLDPARGYWDPSETIEEGALSRVFFHQDWNQRQLSAQEIQRGLYPYQA